MKESDDNGDSGNPMLIYLRLCLSHAQVPPQQELVENCPNLTT